MRVASADYDGHVAHYIHDWTYVETLTCLGFFGCTKAGNIPI